MRSSKATSWLSLPPASRLPMTKSTRGRRAPSAPIDPLSLPQLEHRKVPQARRVIVGSGQVSVEQPIDLVAVEPAAVAAAGVSEHIFDPGSELAPEPVPDRDPESFLGPRDQMLGEAAPPRKLLQEPLRLAAAQ